MSAHVLRKIQINGVGTCIWLNAGSTISIGFDRTYVDGRANCFSVE
jgi:hypothetical protein